MAAWAYDLGDSIGSLEPRGTIGVRLRALTAIILGEGLNGICSTLHQSFDSLSLTPQIIANAIGLLFISFFLWLLYFDGEATSETPMQHLTPSCRPSAQGASRGESTSIRLSRISLGSDPAT